MRKSRSFRSWYYFRQGWSTYFAFIFAAINTLTVTYYLAIERYPLLSQIFTSFLQYVLIISAVGVPLLIVIGYAHYKKTGAFKSEADVMVESNPYQCRQLVNLQIILTLTLQISDMILKLSKNEKLTDKQIYEISKLQNDLSSFINKRTFSSQMDSEFLKKEVTNT